MWAGGNGQFQPPVQQAMEPLASLRGVVVRQDTQTVDMVMQSLGMAYEKEDRYVVAALPDGVRVARDQGDRGAWQPTGEELQALPPLMVAQEQSSTLSRVCLSLLGCLHLRAFTMPFWQLSAGPAGWGTGPASESFTLVRPYKCGGFFCDPLETGVMQHGQYVGQVKEDFSCFQCCCCCTFFANVLEGMERRHKFTLRTNVCCCGRTNNCCGATCCKHNLIIDVLNPEGKLVATIQKTYAPTQGMGACMRCTFEFSNYIVEFPPGASPTEKKLLLAALMHVNYEQFARKGDEGGN